MVYSDIWGVNKSTVFLDRKGDMKTEFQSEVKNEFQAPCKAKYDTALGAIKFLCQFHNCDAIFEALKVDVKRR